MEIKMNMTCRVIAAVEAQKKMYGAWPCSPRVLLNILADAIAEAIPTIRGKPLEKLFKSHSILVGVDSVSVQDIAAMHARIAERDAELAMRVANEENFLMFKWRDKIDEVRERSRR